MPKVQDDDLVMSLVELALTQPLEARQTYVRSACAGDTDLFTEVWEYVRWNDRMQDFLLDPLFSALQEHRFEPGELLADRFRIVREVAQGGMGVVYEADDERLGRRIALKCAKSGFRKRLTPEVGSRSNRLPAPRLPRATTRVPTIAVAFHTHAITPLTRYQSSCRRQAPLGKVARELGLPYHYSFLGSAAPSVNFFADPDPLQATGFLAS